MKTKDPNHPQRPNVIQFRPKLEDTRVITCSCGSFAFEKRFMMRYLSRLVSPNGQPMVLEVPVMCCPQCGKIYDQESVLAAGNALEETAGTSILSAQPLDAQGTMATSTPEAEE